MGQHTWFYKDKELYLREQELEEKIELYSEGKLELSDFEIKSIQNEIDEISDKNDAEYHDLFRTHKRTSDNSYIEEIITSKSQCLEWVDNPDNVVSFKKTIFEDDEQEALNKKRALELINEFWNKYPNGLIDFG